MKHKMSNEEFKNKLKEKYNMTDKEIEGCEIFKIEHNLNYEDAFEMIETIIIIRGQ